VNSKLKDEHTDKLFEAVLMLKNTDECYRFFEDLCTVNELKALAQRLEVASMLKQKKTYLEISEKTGASTATISRVNRFLIYGADGYNMILERMYKPEDKKVMED
jgi:TrpR-related protein YerC/YecD